MFHLSSFLTLPSPGLKRLFMDAALPEKHFHFQRAPDSPRYKTDNRLNARFAKQMMHLSHQRNSDCFFL